MSDHLDNGGVGQSEVLSDGENINVLIRVRPRLPGDEEASSMTPGVSIQPNTITVNCKPQQKSFSFDWVAGPETSQSDIFNGVGKSITDRCLDGYNGTIFAYGQTGSGKTYTMLGAAVHEDYSNWDERGLIPRVLEYLFERISEKEKMNQRFLVKCSYLEIYNDRMTDLLNPGACEIIIREDINQGIIVLNLTEEVVSDASEALTVMQIGSANRRVASTSMNEESSRSHSVFTIVVQSEELTEDGQVRKTRSSRFNLVDLAGSERQRDTGASGSQLKEAGSINRSLSALGNVIMSLVDINNGKSRYVQYRSSKLTFLLKDSLGGNALTYLIATVNPLGSFVGETLSTIKFAARAKTIKNQAMINETDSCAHADAILLEENDRLRNRVRELENLYQEGLNSLEQSDTSNGTVLTVDDDLLNDILHQKEELHIKLDSCKQRISQLEDLCSKLNERNLSERLIRNLQKTQIQKLEEIIRSQSGSFPDALSLSRALEVSSESSRLQIQEYDNQLRIISRGILDELKDGRVDFHLYNLEESNRKLSEKCLMLLQQNDQLRTELEFFKHSFESKSVESRDPLLEAQINDMMTLVEQLKKDLEDSREMTRISEDRSVSLEARLFEQIKVHEIEIADLRSLHSSEKEELEGTILDLKNRLDSILSEKQALEQDLKKMTSSNKESEEKLLLVQSQIKDQDGISTELKIMAEKNLGLLQKVAGGESAIEDLQFQLEKKQELLNIECSRVKEFENSLGTLTRDMDRLQDLYDNSMKTIQAKENRIAELENAKRAHEQEFEKMKSKNEQLKHQLAGYISSLEKTNFELEMIGEDHDCLWEQFKFTKKCLEDLEKTYSETQAELMVREAEVSDLQRELSVHKSQLATVEKSLSEALEAKPDLSSKVVNDSSALGDLPLTDQSMAE